MNYFHICQELQSLGVTANYKGYKQTALAVQLALQNEDRLNNVTKELYWAVAAQIGCGKSSVERNIRTAAQVAWKSNPARLQALAGYPLAASPAASELIAILAAHFQRLAQNIPINPGGLAGTPR